MKQYKVLKDIPEHKAGSILSLQSEAFGLFYGDNSEYGFHESYLERNPDFFEEIIELEKLFTIKDIYLAVEFGCNACLTHDYGDETDKFIKKNFPQHINQLKCLK